MCHELIGDLGKRHLGHIQLVLGNQLKQQIKGPFKVRKPNFEGAVVGLSFQLADVVGRRFAGPAGVVGRRGRVRRGRVGDRLGPDRCLRLSSEWYATTPVGVLCGRDSRGCVITARSRSVDIDERTVLDQ
jgi:hypothetical protein